MRSLATWLTAGLLLFSGISTPAQADDPCAVAGTLNVAAGKVGPDGLGGTGRGGSDGIGGTGASDDDGIGGTCRVERHAGDFLALFQPRPHARILTPSAAVVFPLPLPVITRTSG